MGSRGWGLRGSRNVDGLRNDRDGPQSSSRTRKPESHQRVKLTTTAHRARFAFFTRMMPSPSTEPPRTTRNARHCISCSILGVRHQYAHHSRSANDRCDRLWKLNQPRERLHPPGTVLFGQKSVRLVAVCHPHRLRIPFDSSLRTNGHITHEHCLRERTRIVEVRSWNRSFILDRTQPFGEWPPLYPRNCR